MSLKKYSKEYYQNNGQEGDRMALGMYYRILKRYLPQKSKVLEYGAGNGHLSKRIAKIFQSFATEISAYARNNIKINSPKTKIILKDSEIPKVFFDGVISLHCLEHNHNPELIVKKLADSLKNKGVLILVVPNISGLGYRIKKDKWFGFRDKTHVSLLPENEWITMVKANSLQVIKTGSDWFWDTPYLPYVPDILQKLLFYPGCLLMVILGRIVYPSNFGEDLILVARKD